MMLKPLTFLLKCQKENDLYIRFVILLHYTTYLPAYD